MTLTSKVLGGRKQRDDERGDRDDPADDGPERAEAAGLAVPGLDGA